MKTLTKIFNFIDLSDKYRLFVFLICSIIATLFELISLGSIPVFLVSIMDFGKTNFLFSDWLNLKIEGENKLLILSIILIVIFFLKNIYLSSFIYFQGNISKKLRVNFGKKMFNLYIKSRYDEHLRKNPAIILRSITSDASQSASLVFNYTNLIKETFVLLGIFSLLVFVDPIITISLFFFVLFFVFIFFSIIKKKIYLRSQNILKYSGEQIKIINQTLSSIKEIKLLDKENYFSKLFSININNMEKNRLFNFFLTNLPKFFLETISIFTLALIALFFSFSERPFTEFLPVLTLLAVSSVRLIPSFNIISTSLANAKTLTPAFNFMLNEFKNISMDVKNLDKYKFNLLLDKNIEIKDINFKYEDTSKIILNNINLNIAIGSKIGLIGLSGSGKSTLIDILLGILKPTSGSIYVGNKDISLSIYSWQKNLGYVPQEINLLDDTVIKNIALGCEDNEIDFQRINEISKAIGLDQIVNNLENKFETIIGNRGIKLSGGQIQRIGIARSLYFKPKILVLDESLNSLDEASQELIMDKIYEDKYIQSVILITHNQKLFSKCDDLILISDGRVAVQGNFEKVSKSEEFKNLIVNMKNYNNK